MSARMMKMIRRHCDLHGLPKVIYNKIKKTKKEYNLDLKDTLFLIDAAAQNYYENMEKFTNKMKENEDEQS